MHPVSINRAKRKMFVSIAFRLSALSAVFAAMTSGHASMSFGQTNLRRPPRLQESPPVWKKLKLSFEVQWKREFPNPYEKIVKGYRSKWQGLDDIVFESKKWDFHLQLSSLAVDSENSLWTLTEKGPNLIRFSVGPSNISTIQAFAAGTRGIEQDDPNGEDGYEGIDVVKSNSDGTVVFAVSDNGKVFCWKNALNNKKLQKLDFKDINGFEKKAFEDTNYKSDGGWEGIAVDSHAETTIWVLHDKGYCGSSRCSLLAKLKFEEQDNDGTPLGAVSYENSWVINLQDILAEDIKKRLPEKIKEKWFEKKLSRKKKEALKEKLEKQLAKKMKAQLKDGEQIDKKLLLQKLDAKIKSEVRKKLDERFMKYIRVCAMESVNDELWMLASWFKDFDDDDKPAYGFYWVVSVKKSELAAINNKNTPKVRLIGDIKLKRFAEVNWEGMAVQLNEQKLPVAAFLISDDAMAGNDSRWQLRKLPKSGKSRKKTYLMRLKIKSH